ncbi:uncharacterized protein LOC144107881 [Amblyomma americanum]
MLGLGSPMPYLGPVLLAATWLLSACSAVAGDAAAPDLNAAQLRLVADRLKLDQCRSLVESLRSSEDYALDHTPDGHSESSALSCYRLLDLWNRRRPANSTFHQLLVRLQELGHRDLADDLARVVYGEKVLAVKTNFLSDPFRKLSPHQDLRARSELVEASSSPDEHTGHGEGDEHGAATVELVTFALALSLIMLLGMFICNRLTSRCTIKLPPRSLREHVVRERDSRESTLRLLPEQV